MKLRIFFATDLHGSTRCFNKFLSAATKYQADILFLGGDYCSKDLILYADDGSEIRSLSNDRSLRHFKSRESFTEFRLREEARGALFQKVGAHSLVSIDDSEYAGLFLHQMRQRIETWVASAQARLSAGTEIFVIPGNDDDPILDDAFATAPFRWIHRRHLPFWNDWSIFGWGGSNPTPWHTVREFPDNEIAAQLEGALDNNRDPKTTIFFVHPPPFGTGLDNAPAIDDQLRPSIGIGATEMMPVGSRAVRTKIEQWQPALGLFGHVHESPGRVQIGSTLCVNPGSQYHAGRLAGAVIDLEDSRVARVLLTEG